MGHRGRSATPLRARFLLNSSDLRDAVLRRRGHGLMHALVLRAFHEVGRPAITSQQTLQFLVADPRQQRRIVDLVAVQMKNRQDRAIANRAQKLIDVPGSRQGPRFRFAVADYGRHDQFRIVERRAACVREHVPELSSLMNRARRFRRAVAPNAARETRIA